ncbi:uncharacterized protein [Aristolochia californica]|uniref:uncharacterized protein n=1 Tax=Aristolochia californica TaxID=171875 RepID=UPI0035D6DD82
MGQETPKASGQGVDARLWDCDSSLYDSFELKSFKHQLDSAIASRTLSMPRLTQVSRSPPPRLQRKSSSRISRSLSKILRPFLSRQKPTTGSMYGVDGRSEDGYNVLYDSSSRVLTVIPEFTGKTTDFVPLSSVTDSRVRRVESERFTGRMTGVSCLTLRSAGKNQ